MTESRVDPEIIELLRQASTATLTTQLFARGLRNQFLAGLGPMNASRTRFVGEAFTLRYIPAREDLDVLSVFQDYDHPQRKAIESVGPGQVLVMDCRGDASAASAGNILLNRLIMRGAEALVTDGGLRDTGEMRETGFPIFYGGPAATTNLAKHHAADLNVPIGCAGVPVYPGDILAGDEDGVVVVPRELAAEIAAPAAEQERLEEFVLARVREGAPLRGTYPPDEATRAAYEEWRAGS